MSRSKAQKPPKWLEQLPVAAQLSIAVCSGALAALGQSPYNQPIALIIGLTIAFMLYRRAATAGRAAWLGCAFGTGYFALALIWILEPFQIDPERHAWMAPFALLFLSVGLALFWGGAFWGARRYSARLWPLVATWTAAEMLRAYVLTGFPWATPAQALVEGQAGQMLAWIGPHGVNALLMLLAWILALPAPARGRYAMRASQSALLGVAIVAVTLEPRAPAAPMTDHLVRIVQPNVPQAQKWDPAYFDLFFQRHLELSASPGQVAPDLVIWPEASVPWFLETAQSALPIIAASAGGAQVIFGVNRIERGQLYNALALLDGDGSLLDVYDKVKTVPFGEYIPLGNLLSRIGIAGMATRDGNGFSRGAGPKAMSLGPLGLAQPLICYEAVFAHFTGAVPERPSLLIQVTNDAWFGQDAGPQQHLAQARMRAIEQGLPLARSANTGISAMIDPWGRVTRNLALGEQGALDAPLPAPRPPTLYSRTGDVPIAFGLVAVFVIPALRSVLKRKSY